MTCKGADNELNLKEDTTEEIDFPQVNCGMKQLKKNTN